MGPDQEEHPADLLKARHAMLKAMRQFFFERSFVEVETAYLARCAPSDPYIEPLKVCVGEAGPYYLHTSPEVEMKKMLALGLDRVFQICKAFRVEELEEVHSVEFTMPRVVLNRYVCGSDGGDQGADPERVRKPWREG